MLNKTIQILLISCALSTASLADDHSKRMQHLFILDGVDTYLDYAQPDKGHANAKIYVDKNSMVIQMTTPVYNIHGVETAPNLRTPEEKEIVATAKRKFLDSPQRFFKFTPANSCQMESMIYRLVQVEAGAEQAKPQVTKWHHYDVKSEMYFTCKDITPETMTVDLFAYYPNIKEINAQFIAHGSDLRRAILSAKTPVIQFTRTSGVDVK